MIFQRLKNMWLGFWSQVLGDAEKRHIGLSAQGAVEQQKQNLRSIRDALTNLIFQRKRLTDQLQTLDQELLELRTDVQEAAREDRDELAINLIAKLETAEEEHRFLTGQAAVLEKDIVTARETEKLLAREIVKAEQLIVTLKSRYHALNVRKQLQSELSSLTRVATVGNAVQPLTDQVHRLEAEIETLQVKRDHWEKDWDAMRTRRAKGRHEQKLQHIKDSIRRRTLPAMLLEPVPVPVSR